MTPTLKAMVEAMAAEIARQAWTDPEAELPTLQVDGHLDLEKVARAGLQAIAEPSDEIYAAIEMADRDADPFIDTEHEGVPADPAPAEVVWRYAIRVILGPESGTVSPKNLPKAPSDPAAEPAK